MNEAIRQIGQRKTSLVSQDAIRVSKKLVAARGSYHREYNTVATRHATSKPTIRRRPIDEVPRVVQARERVEALEKELVLVLAGQGPALSKTNMKANPSDPDTRAMPAKGGEHFIQGFNCQIVVSEDHLILTTTVTQDPSDRAWFIHLMNAAVKQATTLDPEQPIGTIVADAGYIGKANLTAPGPDRLIAIGQNPETRNMALHDPNMITMANRLKPGTRDRELYAQRSTTVETVNAHLKDRIGLRRFSRRGLKAANNELQLAAIAFNLLRLHQHINKQQHEHNQSQTQAHQTKDPNNRE